MSGPRRWDIVGRVLDDPSCQCERAKVAVVTVTSELEACHDSCKDCKANAQCYHIYIIYLYIFIMCYPWQVGSNTVRKLEVNEAERSLDRDVQSSKSDLEDL